MVFQGHHLVPGGRIEHDGMAIVTRNEDTPGVGRECERQG
jgi:hypothetical protein